MVPFRFATILLAIFSQQIPLKFHSKYALYVVFIIRYKNNNKAIVIVLFICL
jgi:hypothetical protein